MGEFCLVVEEKLGGQITKGAYPFYFEFQNVTNNSKYLTKSTNPGKKCGREILGKISNIKGFSLK